MTPHPGALAPKIPLYVMEADASWMANHHTNPQECTLLQGKDLTKLRETRLDLALGAGRHVAPCRREPCASQLHPGLVGHINQLLRIIDERGHHHDDTFAPLDELDDVTQLRWSWNNSMLDLDDLDADADEDLLVYAQKLQDTIKEMVETRVKEIQTPAWHERLHQSIGPGHWMHDDSKGALRSAGMRAPEQMGMLVGDKYCLGVGELAEHWLEVLPHTTHGGKNLITAPLGLLVSFLQELTPGTLGYVGDAKTQVMDLPHDLDPVLTELILGLFEPGATSKMGHLPSVVEAARTIRDT